MWMKYPSFASRASNLHAEMKCIELKWIELKWIALIAQLHENQLYHYRVVDYFTSELFFNIVKWELKILIALFSISVCKYDKTDTFILQMKRHNDQYMPRVCVNVFGLLALISRVSYEWVQLRGSVYSNSLNFILLKLNWTKFDLNV